MMMNAFGRTFSGGKPVDNDLRSLLRDHMLGVGGDYSTGYFPGKFGDVASRYKVNRKTVEKIWTTFCATGSYEVQQATKGGRKHLEENELNLLELLKKNRPSMTYKEMKANLDAFTTTNASIPAIGRAVRDRLSEGQMTWKKNGQTVSRKIHSR